MKRLDTLLGRPAVRLTLWYVLILTLLAMVFTVVLYQFADHQLFDSLVHQYHDLGGGAQGGPRPGGDDAVGAISDTLDSARLALIWKLIYFDAAIIVAGSVVSYWLARRTLHPIVEALEAQSRFTADASHELRTPLAVMRTEIEIAQADPNITKAAALALLGSNLEEVNKLHSLAEALLRLSRSNTQAILLAPVSVARVASDALSRVAAQARAAGITTIDDAHDFAVLGDAAMLTELLVILLDNAIKYSSRGSAVCVSTSRHGHLGTIRVTDQGRGIAPGDIEHIFERFYRADASRTSQDVEGHGLGLSIAQTIARVHGGTIREKSTPGKGSVFSVVIKLAEPEH